MRNAVQSLLENKEQQDACITISTRIARQFTIGSIKHRLALKVNITDNGPGIPPDLIETLFYPLVTASEGGTGLGLSIAQSLVIQHGGLIECDSEPGNTVFTITVPLLESERDATEQGADR